MCRLRVTLVGRANVGKSTLFNRLTAGGIKKSTPKTRGKAIVDDRPGVTRDWREGDAQLADIAFSLIDTAGMEAEASSALASRIRQQTEAVIRQSHLLLFMLDGREGITPLDRSIAAALHKLGGRVCVVANKCEGKLHLTGVADGWQLGFGQAIARSAAHGEGMGDLSDVLRDVLAEAKDANGEEEAKAGEADTPIRVAIIGRPNTGKSTLINRLLGEERMLTGPEAGITRDAIDLPFRYDGRDFILTDTAGVRRKARISDMLEKSMVLATRTAIRFAHVVIICVDADEGLGKQDLALARLVADEGRAPVIAATMCDKWGGDTQKRKAMQELLLRLDKSLGQMRGIATVAVSAITGEGVAELLAGVADVYSRWGMRLPTARLNQWLEGRLEAHPPPLAPHKRVRIRYMTQIKTRPPSFALFLNRPSAVPAHYMRYLERGLRDDFGLGGLPLRLLLRKGKNPYDTHNT
ncbi:MAG: ribosome biogenesis GTPase Der [Proteobacteria bacterium]|nr:ribosome biogenesis GTPase Der [Pseudomonadota bacterium]